MLTRELLRYKISGTQVKPSFIPVDKERLLVLAERVIAVYVNAVGRSRGELNGELERLSAASAEVKLARGLAKIMLDRSDFSACAEQDFPAARHALFQRSAALLRSEKCPEEPAAFRELLMRDEVVLRSAVYPDLPENERLLAVKKTFPKELLERYNMVLAQSLMLSSARLDCRLAADEPAKLRNLFKYLKFFRLLFRAARDNKTGMIHLVIDGPASILDNGPRYGLQLASFFPAVCVLKHWHVDCELKLRTRTLRLTLDESSRLVCHYTHFGAYIPEEFRLFQDYFRRTPGLGWTLAPRGTYLTLDHGELAFPDFRFRSASGLEVDVELFHQWHRTPLAARLDYLDRHPDTPLLAGVDRACLKQAPELQARLQDRRDAFLFSSFPGVENVVKALNRFAARENELF